MARIRSIKPEFWTDEKVVSLSPLARLLFIGLWNFVDDEGRAEYSPMRLKMQILPADSADVSELLGEIRRETLITIYEVENKQYLQVNGFSKHQKVDARRTSKIPAPTNCAELRRIAPLDQGRDQGRDKDNSEPNGSGAKAPVDVRKVLFDEGLSSLQALTGKADGSCRKLIGKWLSEHGDDAAGVLAAIRRAASINPAEPVAFIEGCFRKPDPEADIYRAVDYKPPTPEEAARWKAQGLS